MKEGLYKEINGAIEKINQKNYIIENWRRVKARLQKEHPTAKITYKKGRFLVEYSLPADFVRIKEITIK